MKFLTIALMGWLLVSPAWAQGSLTPPGTPAPTMKTLDQIEPRNAITNLPYTITTSGSYYVSATLYGSDGINVSADNVTIDLMGFALSGETTGEGVYTQNSGIVIRNGIIAGFGTGVLLANANGCRLQNLVCISNRYRGIQVSASDGRCVGNTISDCTVSANEEAGVYLGASTAGTCAGNEFNRCVVSDNLSHGFWLNTLFSAGFSVGNRILDSSITANGGSGIRLATSSGGQSYGHLIAGCTLTQNATNGIHIDNASGNRIENNTCQSQTGTSSYGIRTANCASNLIVRNLCLGQTSNYLLDSDDTVGPIVTTSGTLATTNGAPALSPWANFAR